MHTLRDARFVLAAALISTAATTATAVPSGATRETDVLQAWGEVLAELWVPGVSPHLEARSYALVHLAIERALPAPSAAQPIGGEEPALPAAISAAAREALVGIQTADEKRIDALAAARLGVPANRRDELAAASGRAAAAQVLHQRANDGWYGGEDGGLPALHITPALPPGSVNAEASPWIELAPFVLKRADQFSARHPYWPAVDGTPTPDMAITRATAFSKIEPSVSASVFAQFWSGSPIARWNQVARAVLARSGLDLRTRARVLAIVNVAMADATLATLHEQGVHRQYQPQWRERWRPVEDPGALGDLDLEVLPTGDPTSFQQDVRAVLNPPLRNYPALRATVAGAACSALGAVPNVGTIGFELGRSDGGTGETRRFASVADAARECALVASLDGRNTREACAAGLYFGEEIGRYVLKQFRTRKS